MGITNYELEIGDWGLGIVLSGILVVPMIKAPTGMPIKSLDTI